MEPFWGGFILGAFAIVVGFFAAAIAIICTIIWRLTRTHSSGPQE